MRQSVSFGLGGADERLAGPAPDLLRLSRLDAVDVREGDVALDPHDHREREFEPAQLSRRGSAAQGFEDRADERLATWSFHRRLTQVLPCPAAEPLIEGQAKHGPVENLVLDQLRKAAIDHLIDACECIAFELMNEFRREGGLDGVATQCPLRAEV